MTYIVFLYYIIHLHINLMNHCRRYGNYQIIRELGKGGYGEVFLVQDITTSRSYAMKMLDKDKITKENLEEDVLAEVRSMKLARHPYIVRLFEVLKTNKKILLLMEYMDGGDLFDAISNINKLL